MKMSALHPHLGRRHFLASAALGTIAAFLPTSGVQASTTAPSSPAPTLSPAQPASAVNGGVLEESVIGAAPASTVSSDTTVRPFHYRASDDELTDLKRRIRSTRWPERETVNDHSQGVQLATMQKLADYWA